MPELRPMSVPDILDTAFRLYRDRFATFLIIALVVHVPYALLQAFVLPATGEAGGLAGLLLGSLGTLIYAIIFMPLCIAAMTENISAAYLGNNLSAADSYKRAVPQLGALIITLIVVGIVLIIGFMLLVIPGIIFYCWFYIVVPIVILERSGSLAAMSRLRELVKGNFWKVFLVIVVLFLLSIVWGMILQVLLRFVPAALGIKVFALHLLNAFILPFTASIPILVYYDLRIRKEAFDLQMLAAAVEQSAAP